MSDTTQCPTCNTRFKVSQAQLDAFQGLVRCGRCQGVFNATEHLQDDQPSPQLSLPITHNESLLRPAQADVEKVATPENLENEDPFPEEASPAQPEQPNISRPAEPVAHAQIITLTALPEEPTAKPARGKFEWVWLFGCILLTVVLLAQATYFFRVEIAANLPGLKPGLLYYCDFLKCSVPLPHKADAMSIESSDLEANPAQSGVIALNALLRNHAPYAQAYPNIELTLTDSQDKPLARRTFHPSEYLKPDENENTGFAANRELNIKINLDTTDLKASGYRLFLFYPQQ